MVREGSVLTKGLSLVNWSTWGLLAQTNLSSLLYNIRSLRDSAVATVARQRQAGTPAIRAFVSIQETEQLVHTCHQLYETLFDLRVTWVTVSALTASPLCCFLVLGLLRPSVSHSLECLFTK